MSTQETFQAWTALSPSSASGDLSLLPFAPKPFEPSDVEIAITHSSIDGSDLHVLRSGWGPTSYPLVAGHEFVGVVTRVGSAVTNLKIGSRVGVGSQCGSCAREDCSACGRGMEQLCPHKVFTYGSRWPGGEGEEFKTRGGFADRWRGDARFAVEIPEGVTSACAAPMLCAGVTVCAPMRRFGVGEGSRVGIVGIGGVGHLGILFARALGAKEVWAISRTAAKREDVLALGADGIIATDEENGWEVKRARSLDIIISTASSGKVPLGGYLSLLDVGGVFVQIGGPEEELPGINAHQIALNRLTIAGSYIGSRAEIKETLDLVAEKQIRPWIEERPMKDINQALIDFAEGKARYRIVLCN